MGTHLTWIGGAALASVLAITIQPASAQPPDGSADESPVGAAEFGSSCAACHGVDGKGNGPVAQYLNVKPSDLTRLAADNDGVFPFREIFQIIDGRTKTVAHGTRTMPIWGDRYRAEAGDRYGPYGGETVVRGRILELVNYVAALQEPGEDAPVLDDGAMAEGAPAAKEDD